ncbi:MAG: amidase [Myxococcota bacterium]
MFTEYDAHDALGLAQRVKDGEITSRELVETCIARIDAVNPHLNSVIHKLYDHGRKLAEQPADGIFQGVPFLLKDLIQTLQGVPTRAGSRFYEGWIPDREGELARRYRKAGLIVVGKTNTPELGLLPVTEPEIFGPTHNPWRLGHTAGGSSGGAGASVAAGIVPMAHGGDGGGSIRIPSSCCGIFGLKPTRGRTPTGPYSSENWSGYAIEHVLTRSVRDSAAALDAVAGVEDHAPYHPPRAARSFLEETKSEPGTLRIGFTVEPAMPSEVHADCIAAVHDAAKLLTDLGHQVEEVRPGFDSMALARAFFTVIACNTAAEIEEAERTVGKKATPQDFETSTWLTAQLGHLFSGAEAIAATRALQSETRRLVHRLGEYDVLLTPTLGQPPGRHGDLQAHGLEAWVQDRVAKSNLRAPLRLPGLLEKTLERVFHFIPFTPVANFTGQPSMSVPLFWNQEGLPVGTMFTARFGDDATLLRLAAQLEQARPWAERRPPVHA